jgi:hypothetical protein
MVICNIHNKVYHILLLKYLSLQTLALLSIDSTHILIKQAFINLHFHTHTLTYDCGLHIGLLHYLCSFVKANN